MDYSNRPGSKFGGGGMASSSDIANDRRERLRKLALESIDLATDPYILRTHTGRVECKLCATEHPDEGSYLAHTQAKKHQSNLSRRQAKDEKAQSLLLGPQLPTQQIAKKRFVTIGRPHYRLRKLRAEDGTHGWHVTIHLPHMRPGLKPMKRWMASHDSEQTRYAKNSAVQYLLVAAEPYETIGFEVPSHVRAQPNDGELNWEDWDEDLKIWQCQFMLQ